MSKQNNLTDFLTDVANAIRDKKDYPSTQKINPQYFANQIKSIQGGDGEQPTVVYARPFNNVY